MATVRCPLFTAGSTLLVLAVALAVVPLCSAAAGSQRNSTLATAAAAASANETAHSEGSGNDTPAPPSDPVLPDVKAAAVDDKASNFEAALAWDGLSEENLLKYRKRLSALAAQRWKLTKAQAAAAGDPSLEGKIRVCVYPSTPYSFCNTSDPETAFDGYDVKLFREVARRVPWLSIGEWAFQCVEFSDLDYARKNGTCLISLGGLDSSNTLQSGLRSSYSTAESGWQIFVRADEEATVKQLFSPFYAFTWQLWLALVMTAALVGVCLWVFDAVVQYIFHLSEARAERVQNATFAKLEDATFKQQSAAAAAAAVAAADARADADVEAARDAAAPAAAAAGARALQRSQSQLVRHVQSVIRASHEDEKAALRNLDKIMRVMMLNLARVTTPPPTSSLPSQIVVWAWGILTMIIISMFTGATAAGLTAAQLTGGVASLADLRGRSVIVWDVWQGEFKFAGIKTVPMPVENLEDEARMLQALHDHKADAIVMESNWVGYYSNKDCGLVPAGEVWDKVFLGYKFQIHTPSFLEDDINAAIVSCKIDDVFDALQKDLTYQRSQGAGCTPIGNVNTGPTIAFEQVAGLWVMLGIAMLAGITILTCTWLFHRTRPVLAHSISSAIGSVSMRRGSYVAGDTEGGAPGGAGGDGTPEISAASSSFNGRTGSFRGAAGLNGRHATRPQGFHRAMSLIDQEEAEAQRALREGRFIRPVDL